MRRLAFIVVLSTVQLQGCDLLRGAAPAPAKRSHLLAGPPRVESSLALPGGGTAHVIALPQPYLERVQCLAVIGPDGSAAVSCSPSSPDASTLIDP